MAEIIKRSINSINGETIQTCSARELHKFLEVKARFNDWIVNRIADFGFVEEQDFTVVEGGFTKNLVKTSGRPSKEYFLSISMAKELCMVERNAKGKEARLYFIECERIAKEKAQQSAANILSDKVSCIFMLADRLSKQFHVPKERMAVHALASVEKTIGIDTAPLLAVIPSVPVKEAALFNPTELGKRCTPPLGPKAVNKKLAVLGLIEPLEKGWRLTEAGVRYGENRPYERNGHNGFQILWRDAVLLLLQES